VVPGGGLSFDRKRWNSCRADFCLPVKVLSRLFRRLFLSYLETAFDQGEIQFFSSLEACHSRPTFLRYLAPTRKAKWVVYAKPPFAGPDEVLKYVAAYTHSVAISNSRLLDIEDEKVRFRWKDYRDENRQKTMTLTADEFIRRFLLHVLPERFQRIRYYGFLANRFREENLARCRQLLNMPQPEPKAEVKEDYRARYEELTGHSLKTCPACHEGQMIVIETLERTTMRPPIVNTS
jgi:hypothetical protein